MIFFQVRPIFAHLATSPESAGLSGLLIIACPNSSYNLILVVGMLAGWGLVGIWLEMVVSYTTCVL